LYLTKIAHYTLSHWWDARFIGPCSLFRISRRYKLVTANKNDRPGLFKFQIYVPYHNFPLAEVQMYGRKEFFGVFIWTSAAGEFTISKRLKFRTDLVLNSICLSLYSRSTPAMNTLLILRDCLFFRLRFHNLSFCTIREDTTHRSWNQVKF